MLNADYARYEVVEIAFYLIGLLNSVKYEYIAPELLYIARDNLESSIPRWPHYVFSKPWAPPGPYTACLKLWVPPGHDNACSKLGALLMLYTACSKLWAPAGPYNAC